MAQNVGTFSLYLDLTIDTKNAIRRLKGLETSLRQQVGQIFTGLNNSNLEGKLNNVLQSSFTSAIAKAGTGGSTVGLTFGNAVLAGITSILTSSAVLGILEKAVGVAKDFLQNAFAKGIETEKQGIAFRVLLGDPEKSKNLFKQINELAVKTPFNVSELREITKRLLGYGISLEEVVEVTRMLGDVAAGTGGDLKLLAKAYGQVKTLGKVYAEELNQFAEQGVSLRELLAKNRGITVEELVRGMHTGKITITFEEFKKVFNDLYKSKFFNLMAEQADTLGGRIENLRETFELLGQELIGIDTITGKVREGSLFDLVSKLLLKLLNFIRDNADEIKGFFYWAAKELTEPFKDLGITSKDLVIILKSLVSVFAFLARALVIFTKLVLVFNQFTVSIKFATSFTKNFNQNFSQLIITISERINQLKAIINGLKAAFASLATGDFLSFGIKIKQVFEEVKSFIVNTAIAIPQIWGTYLEITKNSIQATLNWLLSAFGLNLATIKQNFANVFNLLLQDVRNRFINFATGKFWLDLGYTIGNSLANGLYSVVISAIESIRSKIREVFNELTNISNNVLSKINNSLPKFKPKFPGFAKGGSFIVDGVSGIDKNLVAFWATKGEKVIIQPPSEQNIDNRQYINKTIIYTTQAKQFLPLYLQ